ncbi:hypothetical protein Lal_00023175 [Lupinus albus]|uniref:Uncharacterized protein n=1 Tax=Lupinus albus TaxID=3870 RepID=A0A6A5NDU9_LUPAL|nr:hypothetical protein Lalb_Chr20g0109701 [Lupinus albus]KAF1881142.1 hypothetical protein Lal_00023175 [Lupinus albus]
MTHLHQATITKSSKATPEPKHRFLTKPDLILTVLDFTMTEADSILTEPDFAYMTEAAKPILTEADATDLHKLTETHSRLARISLTKAHPKLAKTILAPSYINSHELTFRLIHTTSQSPWFTSNNIIYFITCIITFGTFYLFYMCLNSFS